VTHALLACPRYLAVVRKNNAIETLLYRRNTFPDNQKKGPDLIVERPGPEGYCKSRR